MSTAIKPTTLSDRQLDRVAQQFKLLGEPMRLKILQTICRKPLTVNEIVEATEANQSNISKHLSLLAYAGIITRRKEGQFVYYSLTDPMTLKLCELVHGQVSERD
ncbi:MAG: winged helix-turn-helix transcriptional regulator [Acidobacteria bacterium]|nr:winged helix-turn-helix transcriptional regulator [Acidobacteriota bacterium]